MTNYVVLVGINVRAYVVADFPAENEEDLRKKLSEMTVKGVQDYLAGSSIRDADWYHEKPDISFIEASTQDETICVEIDIPEGA